MKEQSMCTIVDSSERDCVLIMALRLGFLNLIYFGRKTIPIVM